MFILVSAWRHTSCGQTTEERMAQTLSQAAVSITITSITDALAFILAWLTPLRAIRFFGAYTAAAVLFTYIYMVTFTAACMVYSGRREAANRRCYMCSSCMTKQSEATDFSESVTKTTRTGSSKYLDYRKSNLPNHVIYNHDMNHKQQAMNGISRNTKQFNSLPPLGKRQRLNMDEPERNYHEKPVDESGNSVQLHLPKLTLFLGSTYADILMKSPVKVAVVLLYMAGLAGAIYGVVSHKVGMLTERLVPDDSYFASFYRVFEGDFTESIGSVVMLAIDEPLDYTQPSVREELQQLLETFRQSKYFQTDERYTISWLNHYELFLLENGRNISAMDMTEFIQILQQSFLQIAQFQHFRMDLQINQNNNSLDATRYFMYPTGIVSITTEQDIMENAREIAENSKFKAKVYSGSFILGDQRAAMPISALFSLGVATASMMFVSIILIPSFYAVFWVTLSTVSIATCTFGYMVWWGINLNATSLVNLIMCIGFSVDFSAHISYHFAISKAKDPAQTARHALGHMGTPILQGALSTIVAVVVLAGIKVYIFRMFFKVIFLVMMFGLYHSLLLLPVVLSTFSNRLCKRQAEEGDDNLYQRFQRSNHAYQDTQPTVAPIGPYRPMAAAFTNAYSLDRSSYCDNGYSPEPRQHWTRHHHSNDLTTSPYWRNHGYHLTTSPYSWYHDNVRSSQLPYVEKNNKQRFDQRTRYEGEYRGSKQYQRSNHVQEHGNNMSPRQKMVQLRDRMAALRHHIIASNQRDRKWQIY